MFYRPSFQWMAFFYKKFKNFEVKINLNRLCKYRAILSAQLLLNISLIAKIMYEPATFEFNQTATTNQQILVFGSNIDTKLKETVIRGLLQELPGVTDISVDRENWERILRLECNSEVPSDLVVAKVRSIGFKCYELT